MNGDVEFPDPEPLRQWLRSHVDQGVHCPACDQYAKVYQRPLHAGVGRVLIAMYYEDGDPEGYVYIPSLRGIELGGDTAKARYWGLIEEKPDLRKDGGRAGWWRLTALGRSFVRGTVSIPKYARIYDGRCLTLTGQQVTIREVLGNKFDYDELMA
jgi:hypothetical protein